MQFRSPEDTPRFAARRNADALKQAGRGKLYKALDLLNEVILVAPNYPDSFWNRAVVFDSLGMTVQAESDRKRARELGYDLDTDLESGRGSGADRPVRRKESLLPRLKLPAVKDEFVRKGLPLKIPTPIVLHLPSLSLGRIGKIGIAVAMLGAVAAAVVLVFLATGDEEDGDSEQSPTASQARPTQTAVPGSIVTDRILPTADAPTISSEPPLLADIGSPFTLESAQAIWEGSGINMEVVALSDDLDDFSALAYDLELSRGVDPLMISALVYGVQEGVADDWLIAPGQRPQAREGRRLPEHDSIWYNQNIVLVIRSGSATLRLDAFESFISLDP